MSKQKIPQIADVFDTAAFVTDLQGLFTQTVSDVTSPEFQAILSGIATDAATIANLKAVNADVELIADATAALEARGQSAIQIPGLVAANKQAAFLAKISNVSGVLIGFGFNVLRAYAGLPPVPVAVAASSGLKDDA